MNLKFLLPLNTQKDNHKKIHFIGLVSDGGVHSHVNHLKGLLEAADDYGLENVLYMLLQMDAIVIHIPEKDLFRIL